MIPLAIDYEKVTREDARLIILRALSEQTNDSLASSTLEVVLDAFVIRKDREWVHDQMEYLREVGAITVVDAGTIKIGTITQRGWRHLQREAVLAGVKRPTIAIQKVSS
jgi:hypothetical protein